MAFPLMGKIRRNVRLTIQWQGDILVGYRLAKQWLPIFQFGREAVATERTAWQDAGAAKRTQLCANAALPSSSPLSSSPPPPSPRAAAAISTPSLRAFRRRLRRPESL